MTYDSRRITKNSLQCNACKDIIVSTHRHDFVSCKCGAIMADGGNEYLRRVGALYNYTDLSEYEEPTKETAQTP